MEFKGTKGKWVISSHESTSRIQINHGQIDVWYDLSPSPEITKEVADADAKLISKAPEMLEMLKVISQFIDENKNKNYMVRLLSREVPTIKDLMKEATTI